MNLAPFLLDVFPLKYSPNHVDAYIPKNTKAGLRAKSPKRGDTGEAFSMWASPFQVPALKKIKEDVCLG